MRKAMVVIFALALVFAMSSTSNAQIATTATGLYVVDVVNGLTIAISDGAASALSAGQTYTVSPDINNPNPINLINGGESATPMNIDIEASAGLAFELTFDLPHNLIGSVNSMPCSFSTTSLYREEDGGLFNPNVANVFSMGLGTSAILDLGITVAVPKEALDGDAYTGYVTATASIVGL